MITVVVETQRVYSHGTDGMPKVEKIQQKMSAGAEFDKFLKYLPYQGYIRDKTKVVKATEKGEEVDKAPFQERLSEVMKKLNTPEETIHDKYAKEKQRNDELMERITALEAKFEKPKENLKEFNPFDGLSKKELQEAYQEKFDKKPFHGWNKDELIEKLKD